jgi:hypothetical protein
MSTRLASPSKKSDIKNPAIESDSPTTENNKNQTKAIKQKNKQADKQAYEPKQQINPIKQTPSRSNKAKTSSKQTSKSIDRQIN